MKEGIFYDVVDRQFPDLEVGWIRNGRFFNALKRPAAYDGDVVGHELRARYGTGNLVLATIHGLVMNRHEGARVFDLVPRNS